MDSATNPTNAVQDVDATARRSLGVWVVVGSGLVALFLGSLAIQLVRDRLHIRCGMGQPGSEGAGTWTCSDGVGYVGVAVALAAMWLLAVLFGSVIAGLVRQERAARTALVLLATASTAWVLGWTHYGSAELVDDAYAPLAGEEYWRLIVGPAAITSIIALLVALVSLFLRGRLAQFVTAAAAIGLVAATVLQPGLGINTIPAAGLLAAAAVRPPTPPRTPLP